MTCIQIDVHAIFLHTYLPACLADLGVWPLGRDFAETQPQEFPASTTSTT